MKKRILCFACAVLVALSNTFTAFAAASVGGEIVSFLGEAVLAVVENWAQKAIENLGDELMTAWQADHIVQQTQYLAYWDEIVNDVGASEDDFREFYSGVATQEYYTMFLDCFPDTIDDICAFVYDGAGDSSSALEAVKTFATEKGLSENDLIALYDCIYVNNYIATLILETSACGLSLDDVCAYCFSDTGLAVDNTDSAVSDDGIVEISGEKFADVVARLNEQYMPYEADTITMLTDKRWGDDTLASNNAWYRMSLYTEGYYAGNSNWTEIYMQPFYYDGTDYWVSSSQIHLWQEVSQDDSGNNVITMYHEEYSMFDSFDTEGNVTEPIYQGTVDVVNQSGVAINFANYRYFDICMNFNEYANQIKLNYYGSYSDYVAKATNAYNFAQICYASSIQNDVAVVRKVSDLEAGNFDNYLKLETLLANQYLNSANSNYVEGADIGFFVSNELIKNGTRIIPPNIDPEATVKMTGDTIYDYTITNTSGDTMTINEYVTNNYTYITNNNDSGSGGGSVSGDVTVSGDIDVNGQVDININLNQGSSTAEAYPYVDPNVGEVLEQKPEMGDGFTGFMQRVLGWLPPELFTLLLGGVGLAVVCRLIGR